MKKVLCSGTYGLGDHLQHSTLPRRYSEMGYDVYLSDRNGFRNTGIMNLVWESNPYIKGITSDAADIGWAYGRHGIYENATLYKSYTMGVESVNDLEPRSKYPEIYYVPKKNYHVPKYVVDCSAITSSDKYTDLDILVYLRLRGINKNDCLILNRDLSGYTRYDTKDIFEYCDLIYSCEEYIGYYSGGTVLTSAIQSQYNSSLRNTMLIKSKELVDEWNRWNFRFDNVNGVIL